jgi:Cys-tRNA(Pro)/Cys-tRNA(Cys) deacylase
MAPDFLMIILALIIILQHKYDIFCQEMMSLGRSEWLTGGGKHSLPWMRLSDKIYPITTPILKGSSMNIYEQRIRAYLQEQHIVAEHLSFDQSCHSVAEAARAVGASPQELVKNICLLDSDGQLITAIVKGEDRVSVSRVARTLQREGLRLATPPEILEKTGYPCGGTPSFGYQAMFLIDPRVMERDIVFTGGGSETSLIKIRTEELARANQGTVLRIRS